MPPTRYIESLRSFTAAIDSLPERIATRIHVVPDGCWLWTGSKVNGGYGMVSVDGHRRAAHRVVYELLVDEIPAGYVLDHVCRTPPCVNPAHMDAVTGRENSLRGKGFCGKPKWQDRAARLREAL